MLGQSNLTRAQETAGREQYNLAGPAYAKSLGFYSDLLGNRKSQARALANPIANIAEAGFGARDAINNRFTRSGARDLALAEQARGQQGDINQLFSGAPLAAATSLAEISGQGLDRSIALGQQAQEGYQSVANMSQQAIANAERQATQRRNFWGNIGKWAARGAAAFFTGGVSEGVMGLAGQIGQHFGMGPQPRGGMPRNTGGFNTARSGFGRTEIPTGGLPTNPRRGPV
jgi:hypothetical protein